MKKNNKITNPAITVSTVSIAANFFLTIFKLLAGILANSAAMLSDAVHSASDVISTVAVIIGVKISEKEADKEHPYGHERLESVTAVILALMLASVGIEIGNAGIKNLISGDYKTAVTPGILALVAAIVSIAIKEAMYQYTMHTAKRINSPALKADAWHHRSDALSSIGALIGIGGAMMGFNIMDVIASLVICIFILKASLDIFLEGVNGLVDHACDMETVQNITSVIMNVDGVKGIDELKSRRFGAKIYIDVEIKVDGNLTLNQAHEIAETVHDNIENKFPEVKHCMVHENPV